MKRAREKRDDARRQLSDGVDPTLKRRAEEDAATNTFKAVADEWLMTKKHALTPATWARDKRQIYKWVVPYLGSKPIASIEAPDLLAVLKKIEAKGVIDTAHRTREVCGRVFRYAIATGRAKHDIAADLVGALAPRTTTHHAAITDPVKVGELLTSHRRLRRPADYCRRSAAGSVRVCTSHGAARRRMDRDELGRRTT